MMQIHIVFGKKDKDLAYWVRSLPLKSFNYYVKLILKAEIRRKTALVIVPNKKGIYDGIVEQRLYISEKEIIEYINQMPSYKKASTIKNIKRRHINANYKRVASADENSKRNNPVNTDNSIENKKDFRTRILRMNGK